MVRESGGGDAQFVLDFAGDHAGGVSGKEQAKDLQARFGAERGETVGAAGDEERIGLAHISMIAEVWKYATDEIKDVKEANEVKDAVAGGLNELNELKPQGVYGASH